MHEHIIEYPSSCTGCEHLAASFVANAPYWMKVGWETQRLTDLANKWSKEVKNSKEMRDDFHDGVAVGLLQAIRDVRNGG